MKIYDYICNMKKENIKYIALVGLLILCIVLIANIESFLVFLTGITSKETVAYMSLYLVCGMGVIMLGWFVYVIIRMVRFERKSSALRKELKLGDVVEISSPSTFRLSGDVSFVEDDFITVSIKMRRDLVYPVKKSK